MATAVQRKTSVLRSILPMAKNILAKAAVCLYFDHRALRTQMQWIFLVELPTMSFGRRADHATSFPQSPSLAELWYEYP